MHHRQAAPPIRGTPLPPPPTHPRVTSPRSPPQSATGRRAEHMSCPFIRQALRRARRDTPVPVSLSAQNEHDADVEQPVPEAGVPHASAHHGNALIPNARG